MKVIQINEFKFTQKIFLRKPFVFIFNINQPKRINYYFLQILQNIGFHFQLYFKK